MDNEGGNGFFNCAKTSRERYKSQQYERGARAVKRNKCENKYKRLLTQQKVKCKKINKNKK